ncbi:MAG TPA: tRNA (adenosine(37)-N6)-threonylcarbamoyltransferase complex dimerization subunit type 1 TsaB [Bryobacteraceae bacterium]|nr:tRNA (adenosine(37)-N6)-threonylcarbamoyltransferase complex dimerization subunit type 1 TsaB [Bryobacteraceae bacterium]
MKILALDTTGEFGSIALEQDGALIAEAHLHSPDGFAHLIFNEIDRLLARADWKIADIDCFAAASGPGSFTGVRVGMTAVKGLAEALGKPVAAVSKLRALAQFGSAERRVVMIDARRGEIYAAVYNSTLCAIVPDAITKLPAWLHSLDAGDYEFITLAGDGIEGALAGTAFTEMKHTSAPRSIASAVAFCAHLDALDGNLVSPLVADANYVRRSDAELLWKDR